MKKLINFFELNKSYKFDPTDLTAVIFTFCAIFGIMGKNVTPLFVIGSVINTAFCWKSHRINLVILNVSLFLLNIVNFFKMF